MSYLVLARKSRPQTFDEVVGQRAVVKTLQNSLRRQRVAHAILFSGVRGVGKTTLARLMAKAINCVGATDNPPCNSCPPCREITAGSALDLIEIDGASNRGIQEIRELKEKIKFLPTSCRYKVIIIDEVHMLTTEAFNALLKTLEEPPEHVHFMFATTELHKIPITILSRCQQYELKRIPATELTAHFQKLAVGEGIAIDPQALALIVREAEGSVRDGLSLLDQVFSFGEKQITSQDVTEVLGLVDRDILFRLSEALLTGDRTGALQSLEDIFAFGMDLKRFSADLLECFRTLLLLRIDGCSSLLDLPAEEMQRSLELALRFSPETIHHKLNLLMKMVEEMRHVSHPRLAMETGFLKVIEAGNVVAVNELLGKLQQLLSGQPAGPSSSQALAPPSGGGARATAPARAPQPPAPATPARRVMAEAAPEPPDYSEIPPPEDDGPHATPESPAPPQPASTTPEKPAPASPAAQGTEEPPAHTHPVEIHPHAKDIRKHWPEFLAYVKERIVWMAQDLNRARVKQVEGELQLHYDDPAECALLRVKENRNQLTEFVLDFFQKELKVNIVLPERETSQDDRNGADSPQQKRQQLAHDPLTIMTAEIFHGQVGDIRIGPRSR